MKSGGCSLSLHVSKVELSITRNRAKIKISVSVYPLSNLNQRLECFIAFSEDNIDHVTMERNDQVLQSEILYCV